MNKLEALKTINKRIDAEIVKAQLELKRKEFNLVEFKANMAASISKWLNDQLLKEQQRKAKNNSNNVEIY